MVISCMSFPFLPFELVTASLGRNRPPSLVNLPDQHARLSSFFSAFTNRHLPYTKQELLSPLESAFTRSAPPTPLSSVFTKIPGGGVCSLSRASAPQEQARWRWLSVATFSRPFLPRGHLAMKNRWITGLAAVTLLVASCGCVRSARSSKPSDTSATLVGAGDIADCRDLSGAEATAKLLDGIPGTVMAVGDLAYPDGSKENFACYDRTWGRAKSRTRPAVGNHEFHAAGGTP
jgi:hypothetical protein